MALRETRTMQVHRISFRHISTFPVHVLILSVQLTFEFKASLQP